MPGTALQPRISGVQKLTLCFRTAEPLGEQLCTVAAGLEKAGDWVQVELSACPSLLEGCGQPVLGGPGERTGK